jgi:hypothetical protein
MIDATELRIGNWVHGHNPATMDPDETGQFQVVEISEIGINFKKVFMANDDWASKVEGIPLNPEILKKCGFEKDLYTHELYSKGRYQVYLDGQKNVFRIVGISLAICPHLHQLQNLYFALTGEEIQYQP